jgi:hypothetical protein
MIPTLVSSSSTMLVRRRPTLLEASLRTSVMLSDRMEPDSRPAARLVANWKTNAAPR